MRSEICRRALGTAALATAMIGFNFSIASGQSLEGTWLLTFETPRGSQEITIVLEAADTGFEGTATDERGESPVSASIADSYVTLAITRAGREGRSFEQKLTGAFSTDTESPTITGEMAMARPGGARRGGRRGGREGARAAPTFTMVKQG